MIFLAHNVLEHDLITDRYQYTIHVHTGIRNEFLKVIHRPHTTANLE